MTGQFERTHDDSESEFSILWMIERVAMAVPAGKRIGALDSDRRLMLQFRSSRIMSDAGLLAYRELDDTIGLTDTGADTLADARTGKNGRHRFGGPIMVPALIANLGDEAAWRFVEFFTANIRNLHTRHALTPGPALSSSPWCGAPGGRRRCASSSFWHCGRPGPDRLGH
jgi:hypothetical protein